MDDASDMMGGGLKGIRGLMGEVTRGLAQKEKELREKAKPLHELVREEEFMVLGVLRESQAHYVNEGEFMIGGTNRSSSAGYSCTTTLNVSPVGRSLDEKIGVKLLVFLGNTVVRPKDVITAKIPRYNFVNRNEVINSRPSEITPAGIYHDREYNPEEKAIEISISEELYKGNAPFIAVTIERSVDFKRYQKR